MKTLKEWLDLRAAKRSEGDDLLELARTEKRDLTTEEEVKYDAIQKEVSDMEPKIQRATVIEANARANAASSPAVHTGVTGNQHTSTGDENDLSKFDLMRAIQLRANDKKIDGVEAEVAQMGAESARVNGIEVTGEGFSIPTQFLQKRGQTATGQTSATGDQGGVTVPTDIMPLLDALWSQTWLQPAGARFMTGLTGNPRFPVQTTKPTVSELTEIQEMGYTEILFTDFGMTPKRRGVTIPISKQIILQSSIDIQSLVMENISKGIAQYMNVEGIGIVLGAITLGNGNLLVLGDNGDVVTYEDLVDLEELVDAKDALAFSPRYLTNSAVKSALKKTQLFSGTNGEPVWGKGNILNDYPAIVSNLVPRNLVKGSASNASPVIFGNFKDLYVGMWGAVEFIVDPFTAKRKAQTEITANTFYDIKVARNESFAGIKDAVPAVAP